MQEQGSKLADAYDVDLEAPPTKRPGKADVATRSRGPAWRRSSTGDAGEDDKPPTSAKLAALRQQIESRKASAASRAAAGSSVEERVAARLAALSSQRQGSVGGEAAGPAATLPEPPPKPVDPALARAASIAAAAKKAASHAVQAARSKQRTSEEDRRRANASRASPEEDADVGLDSSLEITPADLGDRAVATQAAAVAERGSLRPPPDGARAAPAPAPAISPTRARSASQTDVDKLTFSDLAALLRAPIAVPKRLAAATEASPRIAAATIAALDRSRSAIAERDARHVGADEGSHADSLYVPPGGATATLSAPVPAPVPRADEEDIAESAYSEDTFADSSGSGGAGTALGAAQAVAVQQSAPPRDPTPAEVPLSVAPSVIAPTPSLTPLTTVVPKPQPPHLPASAIAASVTPPGSLGSQRPEASHGIFLASAVPGPAVTSLRPEQPPSPPLQTHLDNGDTSIASSVPPPPTTLPPPRPIAMDVSAISGATSQHAATVAADVSQGPAWQGAPPGYAGGGPAVAWNFVQQAPYQVPLQFNAGGAPPHPPPLPFGGYSMYSLAPSGGGVYVVPQPASLNNTALDATFMSRGDPRQQPFGASTSSRTAGAALAIALRAAASVALSKNLSQATHPPPTASVPSPATAPAPLLANTVPDPASTSEAHESRLRGSSPESENSGTRLGSAKGTNARPPSDSAASPKQSINARPRSRAPSGTPAAGEIRISAAPGSRQSVAGRMTPSPYPSSNVDAGAANALIAKAVAERYDAESARVGLEAEVGRLRRLLAQQHPSQSLPQHRQGHERHHTGSPQGAMRPRLPPETHPSLSLISFVDEPSLPTAPHFAAPEPVAPAPVSSAPEGPSPAVLSSAPPAPAGVAASPPASSSMQPRARAARLRASMSSGIVPVMPSEERPIAADDTTAALPPRDDVALPSTLREALAASAVFRHAATRGVLGQRRWAAGAASAADAVPSRNHRGVVYPVGPDYAEYFTDLAAAEAQAASDGLEAFVPLRLVSALQREMEVQVSAQCRGLLVRDDATRRPRPAMPAGAPHGCTEPG